MTPLRGIGRRKAQALAVALTAGAVAIPVSIGSSHREAPNIATDPTADNTDVYAFTAADAPGALTVVSNWIPLEDPAGGPNFYFFDPRARYYVNIDNTGDGRPDVRYRWKFKTVYENPNSFLYALPGVTSIDDPKLLHKQFYSLTRQEMRRGRVTKSRRIARNVPVAPNNVGPKTFPNYEAVAAQAIRQIPGGGKIFAGQIDDPFFVDLGGTFDALNIRKGLGNEGGGKDDLAGYNTHTTVLQVPEKDVTRNGQAVSAADATNAVVGVWSSTERRRLQVTNVLRSKSAGKGRYVQVSRLGNPLVNEVIIPVGQKDRFNRTRPSNDARLYGKYVLKPELAAVINLLFGTKIKETDRTDIVTALLTGIPGLTQISPNARPADTLKINLGVAPNAAGSRFGALAGDTGGFPNGRRLSDDVVDIELRVVAGALLTPEQGGQQLPLGDGVDRNDKEFRSTFPYVASPHDGFTSDPKRFEPEHAPVPQPPTGN